MIDRLRAMPGKMICEIVDSRDETSEGGVILSRSSSKKEVPHQARVLKVGVPGWVWEDDRRKKRIVLTSPRTKKEYLVWPKVWRFQAPEGVYGEIVHFKKYRGKPLWKTHIVLQNADLIGVDDED